MFKQVDYMMVTVSSMQESIAFYRDILGIPLRFESPDWTEFDTGSSTLALHGGGVRSAPSMGQDKTAGVCTIGFNVTDLDRTYEELKAKGVTFVMPPKMQPNEGIKLAVAIDPDGLAVSFCEYLR